MDTSPILSIYVPVITAVFIAAFTLYIVRIARGPTIPDMVLAIDCLGFDLTVFIGLISLYYQTPFLMIGALMLSLWIFIFDLYISKYFVKKELGD